MDNTRSANQEADLDALRALQADTSKLEHVENLLDKFNVFEAIGFVGQEVKHSHFLAFLLNPKQNHGLGDFFLRRMLREAMTSADGKLLPSIQDLNGMDLGETLVHTERHNIDLLLTNETHRFAVIIENKVWSTEHSDQLNRYYQIVRKGHPGWQVLGIYLTPYGYNPSHEAYLPLSYRTVCEILDHVLEDRGLALITDVRISIEHYAQMVRRHILDDPDLVRICEDIYHKHQRAFDLICKYRPDAQTNIRGTLEDLVKTDLGLALDDSTKNRVRFVVRAWDNSTLRVAIDWTSSNYILLFEFWNEQNSLDLRMMVGPGEARTREKVLDMAKADLDVFRVPRTSGFKHGAIFIRSFLAKTMYEADFTHEEREAEIRRQWAEFLDRDLPRIEAAMEKEMWIWDPVEPKDRT